MKSFLAALVLPITSFGLIGGSVPDMKEWPNSIWVGNCSATVVGERVVACASHCMRDGATIKFKKDGATYSAKCTHHTDYVHEAWVQHQAMLQSGRGEFAAARNSTADWALCLTDRTVAGAKYESLNNSAARVSKGKVVTLSGYGCRKWGGSLDGQFRIGQSPITSMPSGDDHDIVTRGSSAICSGDSGGGAYLVSENGDRFVIGVNSRSNTTTTSYLPGWHEETAQEWGRAWAQKNKVKICGYDKDAVGCRGAKPIGPVEFNVETPKLKMHVVVQPNEIYTAEKAKKVLQKAVDAL